MDNYWSIEIETFEEFGKKFVFISANGSSGCEYIYNTDDELKNIITNYVTNMLKEETNA